MSAPSLATFDSQLYGYGHQYEGVRRLRCALAAGPALREERAMSLRDPMPQAEEPDEDPRPTMCENCYGVASCHFGCPTYAPPPAFADEDDPAPMSGRWIDDIDF